MDVNKPSYPRLPCRDDGDWNWNYEMRRQMQEIIPGVYLGPYASATKAKLEEMKEAGLTHVICVRHLIERKVIRPNHPEHFKYLVVEIADSETENIIPHFKPVQQFINQCLASGGKVLVHGNAGVSRSSALVISYVMASYGVTAQEAHRFVKLKRFHASPNEGFMRQLREYEPIYRAHHMVPLPRPERATQKGSVKRTLESDEENTQPNFRRNSGGKYFSGNNH